MANTQCGGFKPLKSLVSGATVAFKRRRVISNNTNGIGCYDAVIADSNGDLLVATTTNTAILSVARGASYVSSGVRVERHHLPAATTYSGSTVDPADASYVYIVADTANTLFEASIDEAMAQTDMGLNYVMVLTAFDTTTGYSKQELDATSRNTTATFPWRVEDFIRGRGDNDVDSADAHVECRINAGFEPLVNTTGT